MKMSFSRNNQKLKIVVYSKDSQQDVKRKMNEYQITHFLYVYAKTKKDA